MIAAARARPAEVQTRPFGSSREHLLLELSRADRRVREAARRARAAAPDDSEMKNLYVSDAEVDALVEEPLGPPSWAHEGEDEEAAAIEARARESERHGVALRLAGLRRAFALTRFDVDVLLMALLPEVDLRIGRLIGYLHDDLTRRRPSVDLVLSLFCRSFEARLAARERFTAGSPLLRHGLLQVFTDSPAQRPPLLAHALKVDDRIIAYLHDSDALDAATAPHARAVVPRAALGDRPALSELAGRLLRFIASPDGAGKGPVIYLEGPPGSGQQAVAETLCHELQIPLLVVDGPSLLGAADEPSRVPLSAFGREARLGGAALFWEGADALLDEGRPATSAALIRALVEHPGLVFLSGAAAWEPTGTLPGRPFLRVRLPRPAAAEQARLLLAALGGGGALAPGVDLEALTGMFRLTPGRVEDAAAAARELARFRGDGGPITEADLRAAFRHQNRRGLGVLARRIETTQTWSDLVLPRDREVLLREICAHVRHRSRVCGTWGFERKLSLGKGLGVLFSGPPGTGKTMAAGVLAAELGLELYHIDLSSVVSKYIGETEKHLARLFDEAEAMGAILFFDEADAVFGKRTEVKDAHDRYANVETSYLLQRIDAYEGMVILASNLTKNMDEAFVRRLRFIVDLPFPREAERRRIWERVLPPETPLAADVDLAWLARKLEVAGGYLRNIALSAAFLAADEGAAEVSMRHLLSAGRREYAKMGKVMDDGYFACGPPNETADRGAATGHERGG